MRPLFVVHFANLTSVMPDDADRSLPSGGQVLSPLVPALRGNPTLALAR